MSSQKKSAVTKAKAIILLAAFISLIMSVYLYFSGDKQAGIYVGVWVPSILSAGAVLLAGVKHE